ncbi:MAG: hypothetical protein ACE148_04260 [Vicinamibacterales bacterium]
MSIRPLRPKRTHMLVLIVAAAALSTAAGLAQAPAVPPDVQVRLDGFEKLQEMRRQTPLANLAWQFLGPTNISGRVTDVAAATPRGKTYTIYAATATGGVWRTDNEGVTWTPIFEQAPSTSIGDVTLAPSNENMVWVGTGEANIFRSSNAGIGVYKSTDGGKTFRHMGLAATYTIARIVIHPRNPDIVYVAASGHEWTDNEERGVYKTTDGGRTWSRVLYVNERTGAIDLAMDPVDPNTLYAATWQRIRKRWNDPRNEEGYTGSGIHKTTDGGRTWTPVNQGLPEPRFRGRIGIDIARSNPNVVYAFVDNYEIGTPPKPGELDSYGRPREGTIKGATVYRSDDRGKTWRQVSGLTPEQKTYMERHSATYGWVFGQIRVDPTNPDVVYTMGLGLNVSEDGGKTFRPLRGMHGDHHALWIDPANPNYLVNGNDGGIVFSYDRGRTWRQNLDNLPAVQFFNVSYDMATPFHVYGSVQDHGSYRAVVDLSRGRDRIPPQEFSPALGGEGTTHAINTADNVTVYASSFYGRLQRVDMSKFGDRSVKPANVAVPQAKGEPPLRGQWLAPTIVSPHNPDIVYHGMQYLFRSMYRGEGWERISPDLSRNDPAMIGDIPYQTIFTISESPKRFGLIYAGTDDGRAHVTRDGGRTWTEITKGLAPDRWISRVVASAFDENTVYLAQNGKRWDDFKPYLWKSTDGGATWKSIVGNIPSGPINVVREDPTSPNILYVGTDMAVFVSWDGGASWHVLGANLPSTFVHDLVVHPRDRVIVIGTHGRGVYVLDAEPVQNYKKGS